MFDSSMSAAAIAARIQELQAAAGIKAQLVNPSGRGAGIITLTGWVALAALVLLPSHTPPLGPPEQPPPAKHEATRLSAELYLSTATRWCGGGRLDRACPCLCSCQGVALCCTRVCSAFGSCWLICSLLEDSETDAGGIR